MTMDKLLSLVIERGTGKPADEPFNWREHHVMVSEDRDRTRIRITWRTYAIDACAFVDLLKLELKAAAIDWRIQDFNWPPKLRSLSFTRPD